MILESLRSAVGQIKHDLEQAIRDASCLGRTYDNGQRAKEALIRSQRLIQRIHEVTKSSLAESMQNRNVDGDIYPPIGSSAPELKVSGFIKAKKQDIVVLMHDHPAKPEVIDAGALEGMKDPLGKDASEHAIVVGVRSQLSSVAKNFDTLMERAFAETLNLRLRLSRIVMGEVYLLPVVEYDDAAMVDNRVALKARFVPIERFIRTFLGISGRDNDSLDDSMYKYDRSCLILIDCRVTPPRVFETLEELKAERVVSGNFDADFSKLSPRNFADELIDEYLTRHASH